MSDFIKDVKLVIVKLKILVVNGYGFDEFFFCLLVFVMKYVVEVGICVFFDLGLKGKFLFTGIFEE